MYITSIMYINYHTCVDERSGGKQADLVPLKFKYCPCCLLINHKLLEFYFSVFTDNHKQLWSHSHLLMSGSMQKAVNCDIFICLLLSIFILTVLCYIILNYSI